MTTSAFGVEHPISKALAERMMLARKAARAGALRPKPQMSMKASDLVRKPKSTGMSMKASDLVRKPR